MEGGTLESARVVLEGKSKLKYEIVDLGSTATACKNMHEYGENCTPSTAFTVVRDYKILMS